MRRRFTNHLRRTRSVRGIALVSVGIACVVAAAVTYSTSNAATTREAVPKKTLKIGWTSTELSLPIIADLYHGGVAEAKRQKASVIGAFAPDAAGQQAAVERLLSQGVDAIVIDPNDSKAIGTAVKAANRKGVPVVMVIGNNAGGGTTVTYIGADEVGGTRRVAEAVFKKIGRKGDVAFIQGDKAHKAGADREKGFRQALKKFPDVHLVAYGSAGWDAQKAQSLALNMLNRNPKLAAIITAYDAMAQGALAAVQSSGSKALVTGIDGECPTVNLIWKGTQIYATLDELWAQIGEIATKQAIRAIKKRAVPKRIVTPSYVMTRSAMQSVLSGKFPKSTSTLKTQIRKFSSGC